MKNLIDAIDLYLAGWGIVCPEAAEEIATDLVMYGQAKVLLPNGKLLVMA